MKHSPPDDLQDGDPRTRFFAIRDLFHRKRTLRKFYLEVYEKFIRCLNLCPKHGIALEIGSGAGFLKEVIPDVMTSDVIAYPGLDLCVDARQMNFSDQSLRAIFMFNVFHHIPDVEAFFREADRCLMPGGRIFIVDQNLGPISYPILKYLHHEPINLHSKDWAFESSGPLSGANGALAWMVFQRDRILFQKKVPNLEVVRFVPHSPLRYWWIGGLKNWSLLPNFLFDLATAIDRILCKIWPSLGSFVDVELVRKP